MMPAEPEPAEREWDSDEAALLAMLLQVQGRQLEVLQEIRGIIQRWADRPAISYCGADCPGHTTGKPGTSCLSITT
jgi:hypothetical protein